jgi:hypothetical protein
MRMRLLLTLVLLLGMAFSANAERVVLRGNTEDISVMVQESNVMRTVIRFEVNAFDRTALTINGELYYSISSGKEASFLNAGEPSLPHINRSILIGDNAEMALRVVSSEYQDFPATPVAPSKGNLLRTVNPSDVPFTFGAIYSSIGAYPAELVQGSEPYILRDYRGMVIEAHPFQYLPDSKTLRVFTTLVVEVVNAGISNKNVLTRSRSEHSLVPDFEQIYQRRFINFGSQSDRYTQLQESGEMLIISYDAFAADMQSFVNWKLQKGIKTRMVNVSTIGNNSTAIKSFVQAYYDSTDLAWLLLVGDAAQVATPSASGGASDPSYAKLAGSDNYPDIFVGRFSAETVAHVQTQVQRTLTYEQTLPTSDWLNKATGVASDQGSGIGHNGGEIDYQHMGYIRTDLLGYTYTTVDQIYDPGANAAAVATALNAGRSFVNYIGHGSTNAWTTSGFSSSNVAALTNTNKLPFIFSVACVNGEFNGYTCFAESWLRAANGGNPTGALAAYMSSINQSWAPPMDAQDEATDLLVGNVMHTFGGMCYNSSCKMIDLNGSGGVDMYNTWHIFGDPSVLLRTDVPATMTLNYQPAIFFATPAFEVEAVGTPKALCALYSNGVLYGSAYTDALGQATININPMLPVGGTVILTVTAFNKATVIDTLPITADLAIIHTPLGNTKNTTTPYEVDAVIYTSAPLYTDSLLLYYQVGSTWYQNLMTPAGVADQYVGYIPAQAPGTVINYYLYAANTSGKSDTTDVFTFKVIDYAMLLNPLAATETAPAGDTVWHNLIVTNDGVLTDSYTITTSGSIWNTTVWDATKTSQISSIGPLSKDQSANVKVRVMVPPSLNGEYDQALARFESQGSPSIFAQATLRTYSAGQPLAIPFFDNFATTTIDTARWDKAVGVTVSSSSIAPPSGIFALNLNGLPSGADTLETDRINLRYQSGVLISFYYEQTGNGSAPGNGKDLFVEYLNNQGNWVLLRQYYGIDTSMTSFVKVQIGVPTDGYHAGFRLRFRNTAVVGPYDDWFVDDIHIDYGPEISTAPLAFQKSVAIGDSTTDQLTISNTGQGEMEYALIAVPDFGTSARLFSSLLASGRVQPATIPLGGEWLDYQSVKGDETPLRGPDVVLNAGGPDAFGYFWVDSDEPGGPVFDWIDIEGTGVIVTGLSDDNFVGPFDIGFSFPYYDSVYTRFYVSSNGMIGFGPTDGFMGINSYSNTVIPATTTPNNMICWCWDDLNIANTNNPGGKVLYRLVGDKLVIQFEKYPRMSAPAGGTITAELILSPDGSIKIQYEALGSTFNSQDNTVGLENKNGSTGLQVALNTTYLHNGLAIQFDKPAQWLYLASAGGTLPAGQSDDIALKFTAAKLDTGNYSAFIRIFSNDPDSAHCVWTVPVSLQVLPACASGDANSDGIVNISDAVYLIAYIFSGGLPPKTECVGDADCSGRVNISDAVFLIAYIFVHGEAPHCSGM